MTCLHKGVIRGFSTIGMHKSRVRFLCSNKRLLLTAVKRISRFSTVHMLNSPVEAVVINTQVCLQHDCSVPKCVFWVCGCRTEGQACRWAPSMDAHKRFTCMHLLLLQCLNVNSSTLTTWFFFCFVFLVSKLTVKSVTTQLWITIRQWEIWSWSSNAYLCAWSFEFF